MWRHERHLQRTRPLLGASPSITASSGTSRRSPLGPPPVSTVRRLSVPPPPPILPRCGANILGKPHSGCVPRHEPCVKLDLEHLHGRHLREEAQEQPSSGWVGAPPGFSRVPGTESPRQGSRRRDTQTSG